MGEIEGGPNRARPSNESASSDRVARLIQPDALKQETPWLWSPGTGVDVWAMFCACITGDLAAVSQLVARDPSLVRALRIPDAPLVRRS
jgi:hypothetical protein